MAIVTRYFSTSGAGAADGTTWADRAELDPSGGWSTVITGFAFNGSDSLKCLVGPGTYTFTTSFASGLFANPPTAANLLFFAGCDSGGNLLAVPDPDWGSAEAAFNDSTLPVIATTTNIATTSLALCSWYLIKFTISGRSGSAITGGYFDWCVVSNSTNNSAAISISAVANMTNSVVSMSGSAFDAAFVASTQPGNDNVKLVGVTGSSGNRDGFRSSGATSVQINTRLCVTGFGGDGISSASATATHVMLFKRCTSANNAGNGLLFPSTGSQTGVNVVEDCMFTGNGAYGIDAQSEANVIVRKCRLRDNTSNNFNGLDNYPLDFNNYTTDSDDATEYVNAGSGDFRIKNTAAIWGQGYGVSDEPAAAGGGNANIFSGSVIR